MLTENKMPVFRTIPWKRNLRKIPDAILAKVSRLGDVPLVATSVKQI
jgi:hypothetical protein